MKAISAMFAGHAIISAGVGRCCWGGAGARVERLGGDGFGAAAGWGDGGSEAWCLPWGGWGGEVRGVAGTSVCGWLGPVAGRGAVDCRCVQGGLLRPGLVLGCIMCMSRGSYDVAT